MKLFLDDVRCPVNCIPYMHKRIGAHALAYHDKDWVIVRSYNEFVKYIKNNPMPSVVSFDHDLGDEIAWSKYHTINNLLPTGYDAAIFLVEYCRDQRKSLPEIFVHSMNPVGRENIEQMFLNLTKDFS